MKTLKILFIAASLLALGCADSSSPSPRSETSANTQGGGGTGKAGSLARFAVTQTHLYIVNDHKLFTYSLQDPANPQLASTVNINAVVETIFPMNEYLLLGTRSGMEIYTIGTPSTPAYVSRYNHIVSCDPVVAQNGFAFSTLRTGTTCNRGDNRLDIINIENIKNPELIGTFSYTNPKGLGLSGNFLYICDDSQIKGLNVTSPYFPVLLPSTPLEGCYDIIGDESSLIVAAIGGVSQFNVELDGTLSLLSTISAN